MSVSNTLGNPTEGFKHSLGIIKFVFVKDKKIINASEPSHDEQVSDDNYTSDDEELTYSELLAKVLPQENLLQPNYPVPVEINPAAPEENHPAANGGLGTRGILRAQRTRRVPKHLNDYIVNLANDTPLPDTSEESTSDNNNSHPEEINSDSEEIESDPEDSDYIPPGYNVRIRRRQNTD